MPWVLILILLTPQEVKMAILEAPSKSVCVDFGLKAKGWAVAGEVVYFSCAPKRTA